VLRAAASRRRIARRSSCTSSRDRVRRRPRGPPQGLYDRRPGLRPSAGLRRSDGPLGARGSAACTEPIARVLLQRRRRGFRPHRAAARRLRPAIRACAGRRHAPRATRRARRKWRTGAGGVRTQDPFLVAITVSAVAAAPAVWVLSTEWRDDACARRPRAAAEAGAVAGKPPAPRNA
jgi:hypothetical protein